MSRLINVAVMDGDTTIGVIENITIGCKKSFTSRLTKALEEYFDGDVEITNDFNYENLFNYADLNFNVGIDNEGFGCTYETQIKVSETWFY